MMLSKIRKMVTITLVTMAILFVLSLFLLGQAVKNFISGDDDQLANFASKNIKDLIAVVEVTGVILDSQKVIENLISAEKNSQIKAIIVRVDSPGGAVGPSQEIYQEILRIDKIKPVYSSMGSVAASGGYYICAATRRIYANAGTLTGSIGVIMQLVDLSKLYAFAKINPSTIKSGNYKDAGNTTRPLTEKEKGLLQGVTDSVHHQFIRDILAVRKKKIVANMSELAQGQIFSGEEARKLGLIDREASLWTAGREIHQELKLNGDFQLLFIKKHKNKFNWSEFFNSLDDSVAFIKKLGGLGQIPLLLYNI
ncbi:MAG: signal peptide peptidase SppA [Oligoflexia bacterium]|nr:signal peptide peptidase SppA [Oligoflexia bacterium]